MMDSMNYTAYEHGVSFKSEGGYREAGSVEFRPTRAANWHLVVEPIPGHAVGATFISFRPHGVKAPKPPKLPRPTKP
jgi:hypothetical protein